VTEVPFFLQCIFFFSGAFVGFLIGMLVGVQFVEDNVKKRAEVEQRVFHGTIGSIDLP
tara:strand:- start:562 stop:735 length:174 start_codon:yes stop_codon:yes gene_type:complete